MVSVGIPPNPDPPARVEEVVVAKPDLDQPEPSASDPRLAAMTEGLRVGSDDAWREFHAAYFDRLLRLSLAIARGDEATARDIVQQTFLRVARHARRFDRDDAFWPWLARLARSAAIDGARRRHRYAAALAGYAREWFSAAPQSAPEPDPDWDQHLATAMESLDAAERGLVADKYDRGLTVDEIATTAGHTPKAVESRLARVRAKLREHLLRQLRHENHP